MKKLLWIVPLYLLLTGCPPPQTVSEPPYRLPDDLPSEYDRFPGNATVTKWIHYPLHPGNEDPVNFVISAIDSQKIVKVELAIYEYELYKNALGLPSKRKRENGIWGVVKSFEPDIPITNLDHSFTFFDGFLPHSNVEYVFSIYNSSGGVTRKFALFDAGDSPWPKDKILLYATSRAPLSQTINLCFLPDTDYGEGWPGFLEDVEALIFEGYHSNNKIESNKDLWSFYYTQQPTDGLAIMKEPFMEENYPSFLRDSIISGIDAFGLLHKEKYSDGAYTNSNIQFLAQNLFTSEGYNWGTAIHETAHAVFQLSDEYNGCFCFGASGETNVFKEKLACENFNISLGYPAEDCTEILAYDGRVWYLPESPPLFKTIAECQKYNVENGLSKDSCRIFQDFTGTRFYQAFTGVCIMQDDGDGKVPPFRHACGAAIDEFYSTMVPADTDESGFVLAEAVDNFFGYEPVMVVDFTYGQEAMDLEVKDVIYGIPTKDRQREGPIQLSWEKEKSSAYKFTMDRPDCMHIHHGEGKLDVATASRPTHCNILVPLEKGVGEVKCKDYSSGKVGKSYSFKKKKGMMKKVRAFKKR